MRFFGAIVAAGIVGVYTGCKSYSETDKLYEQFLLDKMSGNTNMKADNKYAPLADLSMEDCVKAGINGQELFYSKSENKEKLSAELKAAFDSVNRLGSKEYAKFVEQSANFFCEQNIPQFKVAAPKSGGSGGAAAAKSAHSHPKGGAHSSAHISP